MSNSSGSTNNSSEINSLKDIATGQVQLSQGEENLGADVFTLGGQPYNEAGTIYGQANDIYSPAYNQYTAGISGQLTPAQQALVSQNLATTNLGTEGTYAGLGLGGSTMEGQDLGNNQLKSEAENANISFGNEELGLSGLSTANQYFNTSDQFYNTADQYFGTAGNYYSAAGNALSGASTSVNDAGNLASGNLKALESSLSSLGNTNKSGTSGLSSLFGSSGGSGLSSLFGSSGGSAAAGSGVTDASTGLLTFA